ncbi:hypothetical protein J7J83_03955 [bacterium]|nr:hypothetical protein [bacterium]
MGIDHIEPDDTGKALKTSFEELDKELDVLSKLILDNNAIKNLNRLTEETREEFVIGLNDLFAWLREKGIVTEDQIQNDSEFKEIVERLGGARLLLEKIPDLLTIFIRQTTLDVLEREYRASKVRRLFTTFTLLIGILGIAAFSYGVYRAVSHKEVSPVTVKCQKSMNKDLSK